MKRLLVCAALLVSATPTFSQSVTIQGTVTDAAGASSPFGPITIAIDSISITSASVDKPTAPVGTLRTLTITATSSGGSALSAPLPTAPGIAFTPVAGQPAGTFKWTFTY